MMLTFTDFLPALFEAFGGAWPAMPMWRWICIATLKPPCTSTWNHRAQTPCCHWLPCWGACLAGGRKVGRALLRRSPERCVVATATATPRPATAKAFVAAHPFGQGCASTTVELRGQTDVRHDFAQADAAALMAYLVWLGAVKGDAPAIPALPCQPTPLAGAEVLQAPHAAACWPT